ncbi:MAG: hypothetical protein WCV63_05345 [Negativicutes bacterium]|jgi:hypothetical protein
MKKLRILLALALCLTVLGAQTAGQAFWPFSTAAASKSGIDVSQYPASDKKEFGQLKWVMDLANQDLGDFKNFEDMDEQGASACRYEIAFSNYFLAAEQYHKFPAWQGPIQNAFDRMNQRMLQKRVWQYWNTESPGVTKYEPKMNRPYPAEKDPVAHRNIMYSGHLGMMINLYQMLYNDRKWDKPGSIVFQWDDKTKFVYDNKTLQEAMFLQLINNPVPGVECEPNAIFPACNTHPMLSWREYDQQHGTRYFEAAHPAFDKFFADKFINPQTHEIGAFYLIKQGWVFSGWNPRFGNKMDPLMAEMVKKGANFNSSANDGWVGTFMHAWNPQLINELWPYMKKSQVKMNADGSATLTNDSLAPDAYYGFFTTLAAEVGDEQVKNGLLKTMDNLFQPQWSADGAYHYPFIDAVPTVNLISADSDKAKPVAPAAATAQVTTTAPVANRGTGALCCQNTKMDGEGVANNMKTLPQHSNVVDRLAGLARALPKDGLLKMYTQPFDEKHFTEPAITGVDIARVTLTRAQYDRSKQALVISLLPGTIQESSSFNIINLDPAKTYLLYNNIYKTDASGKTTITDNDPITVSNCSEYPVTVCGKMTHDIILKQK